MTDVLRRSSIAIITGLTVVLWPLPVSAWGSKGHRAVAVVASHFLSEKSMAELRELLGPDIDTFIEGSTWADDIRLLNKNTASWHFVNIPVRSGGYSKARDCAEDSSCVVAKIDDFARQIADRRLPNEKRAEALKFVVHFVGDIHQPLHAADYAQDFGGNSIWVSVGAGKPIKLHALWDTGLVDALGSDSSTVGADLVKRTRGKLRAWRSGTPESWANESMVISRDKIYPRSHIKNSAGSATQLPATYMEEMKPVVADRIAMAGVRLAWVLNRAFKDVPMR